MLINQPDIARYAVKVGLLYRNRGAGLTSVQPGVALWPQAASMASGKFVVFVLGIVSSAACKQIYGVSREVTSRALHSSLISLGHRLECLGHLQLDSREQLHDQLAGGTSPLWYHPVLGYGRHQLVRQLDPLRLRLGGRVPKVDQHHSWSGHLHGFLVGDLPLGHLDEWRRGQSHGSPNIAVLYTYTHAP